jgi:hypothetical protein
MEKQEWPDSDCVAAQQIFNALFAFFASSSFAGMEGRDDEVVGWWFGCPFALASFLKHYSPWLDSYNNRCFFPFVHMHISLPRTPYKRSARPWSPFFSAHPSAREPFPSRKMLSFPGEAGGGASHTPFPCHAMPLMRQPAQPSYYNAKRFAARANPAAKKKKSKQNKKSLRLNAIQSWWGIELR